MIATIQPTLDVKVTLQLSESEAAALHAITVYGAKEFLDAFYKTLGRHYLEPHAGQIAPLFEKLGQLDAVLEKAKRIRKDLPHTVIIK